MATATKNELVNLSDATMKILANFAEINENVFVRDNDGTETGHTISTINGAKNLYSQAKIPEVFPKSFGIWDLHKFLSVLSMTDKPILDFSNDSYVVISSLQGSSRVRYFTTSENLLTVPSKKIQMPKHVIEFELTPDVLSRLLKSAAVLNLPDLCIQPCDSNPNSVSLVVLDKNDKTSNTFTVDLDESANKCKIVGRKTDFKLYVKIENLKMLPGTYEVKLAEKAISEWKKSTGEISYVIALDKDSVYP